MGLLRRIPLTPFGWVMIGLIVALAIVSVVVGSGVLAGAALVLFFAVVLLMLPPSPSIDRFGGRFRRRDSDRSAGPPRP